MLRSLKTEAYDKISKELKKGRIKPGEPISESELKNRFGISRTPIREALILLEQEGIIKVHPRRGIFVSEMTLNDIREVFEIRESLEGMAAGLAAKKISREELKGLEDEFEEARRIKDDVKRQYHYERIQDRFHDHILEACGNKRIQKSVKSYRTALKIGQQIAQRIPGRIERSYKEHLEILDAIKKGDQYGAEEKMRQHIRSTYESIKGQ